MSKDINVNSFMYEVCTVRERALACVRCVKCTQREQEEQASGGPIKQLNFKQDKFKGVGPPEMKENSWLLSQKIDTSMGVYRSVEDVDFHS